MKKRLIALMIASTITATALTGCSDGKDSVELENEDKIRQMLEYDANTNISKDSVKEWGFGVDYEIKDSKFYITFKTYAPEEKRDHIEISEDVKIKYEVDKDIYYAFKNHYNLDEKTEDVERVKELVEKYDPVEVINPSMDNIEKIN